MYVDTMGYLVAQTGPNGVRPLRFAPSPFVLQDMQHRYCPHHVSAMAKLKLFAYFLFSLCLPQPNPHSSPLV